jgi:hypothetical protein
MELTGADNEQVDRRQEKAGMMSALDEIKIGCFLSKMRCQM